MKNAVLLVAVVLFLFVGLAYGENPINKGNIIIGGQILCRYQSGDLYEYDSKGITSLIMNPSTGVFVSDGLMLGATLDLESISSWGGTRTRFAIGPKIGYYLNASSQRESVRGSTYPYFSASFTFGKISQSRRDDITISTVGVNLGAVAMISNAVGVDFGLRISSDKWSIDRSSESGITLEFGVGIISFLR